MNVTDFQKMKDEGRKISMVTCYDYSSARVVADSNIDCILVGDSLAMTMHGYANTFDVIRTAPTRTIESSNPELFPSQSESYTESLEPKEVKRTKDADSGRSTHMTLASEMSQ